MSDRNGLPDSEDARQRSRGLIPDDVRVQTA